MINSVIFQNHGWYRIILCTEGQSINSRCPISYHVKKDDITYLVKIRNEGLPNIEYFQRKTPPNTHYRMNKL
jgi:hypothetical protein